MASGKVAKAPKGDDATLGGVLDKDDLFEILQEQIDLLSMKSKSLDGITRDDLKPLIKAVSDLRGVGLGSDETVKKAVDFQMRITRQLVVQQDVKNALATKNYHEMRAAVMKARDILLQTRQVKQLESELLALNKELLKKAGEENERLRKQQTQQAGGEPSDSTQPASNGNVNGNGGKSNQSSTSASPQDTANGTDSKSKRFFWRRGDKKTKSPGENAAPDDYQLDDDTKNEATSPTQDKRKNKSFTNRLSFKKVILPPVTSKTSGKGGPDASPSSPSSSKEAQLDDLLLTENPEVAAQADAMKNGMSEFQRQAQFDKLVEAMQRVKILMDSPQEKRGPSPILAAAGPDLDLVTGDPNSVHMWLGEWHGVVKAFSPANISSKTILVGEIDSKVVPGRWEIRMAKDSVIDNASKSSTALNQDKDASSSNTDNGNSDFKSKEQQYLTEIEALREKLDQVESELKQAKDAPHQVRAAAPEVEALMMERSESHRIEAKQEEDALAEERRRMQSITGVDTDAPSIPSSFDNDHNIRGAASVATIGGGGTKRKQADSVDFDFSDLDPDMMTLKELKQFIVDHGESTEGLLEKSDFVAKVRQMKGISANGSKSSSSARSGEPNMFKQADKQKEILDGPKVQDDDRFAKYFKMLKVGLDKEATKHKMIQDGLESDAGVIDLDPETTVAEWERRKKMAASSGVKIKDDERFAKYFRMLKVGLNKDVVKHKMVQDGLDPDILDMDPESSVDFLPPPELVPYLKMLDYGVPREVVELKMKSNNLDPSLLDQFAPKDIPRLDIKVGDDPRFKPFFKMLGVGVPRDAVKQKMISKGFDPEILDMNPNEFSPVDGSNINPNRKKQKRKRPDDGMQWKKLYWQPVEVPQPGPGVPRTVWTRDFGFELLDHEKAELRSLFAIKVADLKQDAGSGSSQAEKDKSVQILESTRAQNVSILLSKFKISIGDIKRMICTMRVSDGLELTADDVKSLLSMLPTAEEAEKLRAVPAEKVATLGAAERHFMGLMDIPRFRSRIACFLFKLQFNEIKEDCEFDIEALQKAVTELLDSQKLARLLNIILAIGNMLNSCGGLLTTEDGFKPVQGFKLSSLSKVRLAKAHTTNKTALNFFVSILHERQRQVLDFILSDTDNIRASASVVMGNVKGQVKSLAMGVKELENEVNYAESVRSDPEASEKMSKEDELFFDAVEAFFQRARRDVHDLSSAIGKAEKDYEELLKYFREDANTPPDELFKHLVAFFDDVQAALHENDVARAKAVRKAFAQEEANAINDL